MTESHNPQDSEPTYQLNDKQELFCQEYLKDRNATKAYIRAGYAEESAESNAYRLMVNDGIRSRINELIAENLHKLQIDVNAIIEELKNAATIDIADAYDEDGKLLPVKKMPLPLRKAIASIKTEELYSGRGEDRELTGYTKEIRLWDKTRHLELLGKHLKMFADVHEIPGLDRLAQRMKTAEKRVKQETQEQKPDSSVIPPADQDNQGTGGSQ